MKSRTLQPPCMKIIVRKCQNHITTHVYIYNNHEASAVIEGHVYLLQPPRGGVCLFLLRISVANSQKKEKKHVFYYRGVGREIIIEQHLYSVIQITEENHMLHVNNKYDIF